MQPYRFQAMKIITSKYAGTCACCAGAIKRGESIAWSREKGAQHLACHQKQATDGPDIGRMVDMHYEDQCAAACGLL